MPLMSWATHQPADPRLTPPPTPIIHLSTQHDQPGRCHPAAAPRPAECPQGGLGRTALPGCGGDLPLSHGQRLRATQVGGVGVGVGVRASASCGCTLVSAGSAVIDNPTPPALPPARVAIGDVELGGTTIRAGEGIIALNQSANRDEDVYPGDDDAWVVVLALTDRCG